jgi:dienelactone hydrolase
MALVGAQLDRSTPPREVLVQQTPGHQTQLETENAVSRRERGGRGLRWERLPHRRALAGGLLALAAAVLGIGVALATSGSAPAHHPTLGTGSGAGTSPGGAPPPTPVPRSSFAVGIRTLDLVDDSRSITLHGGSVQPRSLVTYVRYPAVGSPGGRDLANASPAREDGPFPLIVFGHGFNVTPALYSKLLHAWAQAGYVVAAPVFPLENANAPEGANENDLTNQPADMRFVISRLLAASANAADPLAGLLDPGAIAVTGQSDGGDTALAVAYDSRFKDPRVTAAVILSGAEIPATGSFTFLPGSPPLLATQGSADNVNPPYLTETFFEAATRPKYLLRLPRAEHLPPYTGQQPQLTIVERVTTAFLDAYLKHRTPALQKLGSLGNVPGSASLLAEP